MLERVQRVHVHPQKFSNGCSAPLRPENGAFRVEDDRLRDLFSSATSSGKTVVNEKVLEVESKSNMF